MRIVESGQREQVGLLELLVYFLYVLCSFSFVFIVIYGKLFLNYLKIIPGIKEETKLQRTVVKTKL